MIVTSAARLPLFVFFEYDMVRRICIVYIYVVVSSYYVLQGLEGKVRVCVGRVVRCTLCFESEIRICLGVLMAIAWEERQREKEEQSLFLF